MKRTLISLILVLTLITAILPQVSPAAEAASSYYIKVDIKNQITTVYRSSDDAVVRQMICSTGTGNNTPRGTFSITTRTSTDRKPWYYLSKYKCYVKYATRITGPILFHSLPYNSKNMDDIDTTALKRMGKKASHGCVRLYWEDAKWIAENCPNGTKVRIFDNGSSKTSLKKLLKNESYSIDSGLTYAQFKASDYKTSEEGAYGRGATGDEITALQNRLLSLGFFSASITGTYDNGTISAILRYQAATGREQTGITSAELYDEIMSQTSVLGNYVTYTENMSGPVVEKLQTTLNRIGLYSGPIDGVYSSEMAQAVNIFCHCAGITPSTSATPTIQTKAESFLADLNATFGEDNFDILLNVTVADCAKTKKANTRLYKKASTSSSRLKTISRGKKVTLLSRGSKWSKVKYGGKTGYILNSYLTFYQTTSYSAAWGIPANTIGEKTLNTLCMGDAVAALKQRLNALGFFPGNITPLYNTGLETAVKAYQTAAGYEPTGEASPALQAELFSDSALSGTLVTLQQGTTSPAVAAMQQALKDLGYYSGNTDGVFDDATSEAVKCFTKVNGIGETATATTQVQESIFNQRTEGDALYGHGNYVVGYYSTSTKMVSTKQSACLYKKASYNSKRLATLKKNKKARLVKKGSYWSLISYGNYTGYVRTKYLSFYTKVDWTVEFIPNVETQEPLMIYGSEDDVVVFLDAAIDESSATEDYTGIEVDSYEDIPSEDDYIDLNESIDDEVMPEKTAPEEISSDEMPTDEVPVADCESIEDASQATA